MTFPNRGSQPGPLLALKVSEKSPTIDIDWSEVYIWNTQVFKGAILTKSHSYFSLFRPIYSFPRNRTMCIEVDLDVD